jgi:hypothetical protein
MLLNLWKKSVFVFSNAMNFDRDCGFK